ncbi:MAG: CPBP family intramembrane metalloprotease [Desulfovibrio sp.]|nr:CPBP family intramembrane metalloprotease [Desulfovibrio sp.]
MTVDDILRSFALAPLLRGLSSSLFWLCAALAFVGLFFPARPLPRDLAGVLWFVCAPFLEEFTWRTLLQGELNSFFPGSRLLGAPNIFASAGFAAAHTIFAPGLLSVLTFFPSLIFGCIWTKFHSTWLCGLLHLWYNFVFRAFQFP